MNLWGEQIPDELLSPEQAAFLRPFAANPRVTLERMWHELDAVWLAMGLDQDVTPQGLAAYYAHPVWMLNGIFTATDPASVAHRSAIARWLAGTGARRIADFGGGSGELARAIAAMLPDAHIDIVEPFPTLLARHRTSTLAGVRWAGELGSNYDAVIAQDVLEHVSDPVAMVMHMAGCVREGGCAVIANCFYPVIRCHLPQTFFLRHTFNYVVQPLGIVAQYRIPGADHVWVYRRSETDLGVAIGLARRREALARCFGMLLNGADDIARLVQRVPPPDAK